MSLHEGKTDESLGDASSLKGDVTRVADAEPTYDGEPAYQDPYNSPGWLDQMTRERWYLVAVLVAFFVAATVYRLLVTHSLGHTGLMFLGIPLILAVILSMAPRTRSVTGGILRAIALALLLVAPLLGEGYLCILVASPLFFLVGLLVGVAVDAFRRRQARGRVLSCVTVLMLPLVMEGVVPGWSARRSEVVEATKVVAAPAEVVAMALAQPPDVTTKLPWLLRIGFPRPLEARGGGLAVGDTRRIHFAGAEGDPPGDLVMRVAETGPAHARFVAVGDSSKLTQWVLWQSSDVTWRAVDAGHTEVRWRIAYQRELDPFWYFRPWEQVAVRSAARWLIDANVTAPAERMQLQAPSAAARGSGL